MKTRTWMALVLSLMMMLSAAAFAQRDRDDDPTEAYRRTDDSVDVGISAEESPDAWFDEGDSGFGDPFSTDQDDFDAEATGQDGMGDYD